jgi:protein-disulfide isomerase
MPIKMRITMPTARSARLLFASLAVMFAMLACSVSPLVNKQPTPTRAKPTQTILPGEGVTINTPAVGTSLGDLNAPVKIDVWEDFQCPACVNYSQQIEPKILTTYVATGKVFYTFHFYPFLDGGKENGESHLAAYAAMCAVQQGKFWQYHAVLVANWDGENQRAFRTERLLDFARYLGLDESFANCLDTKEYASQVQQDYDLGSRWGVTGTPSVFVNGTILTPGYVPSFNDISAAVEAALSVNP